MALFSSLAAPRLAWDVCEGADVPCRWEVCTRATECCQVLVRRFRRDAYAQRTSGGIQSRSSAQDVCGAESGTCLRLVTGCAYKNSNSSTIAAYIARRSACIAARLPLSRVSPRDCALQSTFSETLTLASISCDLLCADRSSTLFHMPLDHLWLCLVSCACMQVEVFPASSHATSSAQAVGSSYYSARLSLLGLCTSDSASPSGASYCTGSCRHRSSSRLSRRHSALERQPIERQRALKWQRRGVWRRHSQERISQWTGSHRLERTGEGCMFVLDSRGTVFLASSGFHYFMLCPPCIKAILSPRCTHNWQLLTDPPQQHVRATGSSPLHRERDGEEHPAYFEGHK